MATVFIAAIASFSILFSLMLLFGLLGSHPWLMLLPAAFYVYKEVQRWLSTHRTSMTSTRS